MIREPWEDLLGLNIENENPVPLMGISETAMLSRGWVCLPNKTDQILRKGTNLQKPSKTKSHEIVTTHAQRKTCSTQKSHKLNGSFVKKGQVEPKDCSVDWQVPRQLHSGEVWSPMRCNEANLHPECAKVHQSGTIVLSLLPGGAP